MAGESFPVVGIGFDPTGLAAADAALDANLARALATKKAYDDLGSAASGAAAQVKSASASPAVSAPAAISGSNGAAAAAAQTTSIWQASDRARAVSSSQLYAINRNLRQLEAADAAATASAVAGAAASQAAAEQAAVNETLAAHQAALAAEVADAQAAAAEQESVELHLAQFRMDVNVQAQRSAAEAAAAEVAAAEAAAAEQESIEAHLLAFRLDVTAQRTRAAAEAAAAEIEAAELAAAAQEQGVIAAAANANAMVSEAQANVRAAQAAGGDKAAVQAQSEAYIELAVALRAASAARQELAGQKAEAAGTDTGQAIAAVAAQTEAAALTAEKGAKEAAGAIGGIGISAITVRETLVELREGARGDFSRMAGSASILLQSIGGIGAVIAAIPIIAFGAAVAGLAYEMAQGSAQAAQLNNSLAVTNQYAGITADSFNAMSAAIAGNTNTAIGKVEQTLETLVAGGHLSGDALGYVADASARLAELTGQDANKVAQQLSQAFSDPAQASADLTAQYHYLTSAQLDHIQRLQEEGEKAAATNLAAKDLDEALKNQTANLGVASQAWRGLTGAISGALQAIRDYGKAATPGQSIATAQAALKTYSSYGAGDEVPDVLDSDKYTSKAQAIAHANQVIADSQKALGDAAKESQDTSIRTSAIAGQKAISDGWDAIRQNTQKATDAQDNYANGIKSLQAELAITPKGTKAYANIQTNIAKAQADQSAVNARYEQQYAGGRPARNKGAGQAESAQKGVDDVGNAITSLNAQLNAAASPNLDPLAEGSAKIQKAYDDAFTKFKDTTNKFKQGDAEAFASSAAEKERLTLLLQLADAENKAGRAEQVKLESLQAEVVANDNAARAIDAYYLAGGQGAAAYAGALANQAQAVLDGKNRQDELTIAQQFGVTSIDQIAAHVQTAYGVSAKQAQQIQDEAQRRYVLTAAVNAQTDALKAQENQQAGHTAALASIDDLTKEAAAYTGGTAAIAAYEREKGIAAALVGKVPAGQTASPEILKQVTDDANAVGGATAVANQAKLNQALAEQERLTNLTSEERARDADVQARIKDLIAAGVPPAQATADAYGDLTIKMRQAETEAAKLKISIQDSIEQSFVDTGQLDFSSLEQGIEKAMRKAVYDSLLAQPINVVVNATVDLEKQALQSLLGTGGASGTGLLSGLSSSITSFLGLGQSVTIGQTAAPGSGLTNVAAQIDNYVAAGSKTLVQTIGSSLGKAIGGAGIGSVTGTLASSIFGTPSNTGSQAGGAIGGLIGGLTPLGPLGAAIGGALGSVLGGLLGGKPTNAAAVVSLDGSGNVTGIGGGKRTSDTTNAATSVAQSVEQIETALRGAGATLNTTVSTIDLGVRDDTHTTLSNGQVLQTAVGDTAAAVKAASTAILQGAVFQNAQLQKIVSNMVAAGASIQDVSTKIDEFNSAQTFTNGLQTAGLQYTDPLAYQLSQLQTAQAARQTQFNTYSADGVIDPSQTASLQASLTALDSAEVKDAISKYSSSIDAAAHSTQDYIDAQQKVISFVSTLQGGSLSDLSPLAQVQANASAYQDALTKAQGGDYDSLSDITDLAQTYLQSAQKFYASGSNYSTIFDTVSDQLSSLGTGSLGSAANVTSADITQATSDLTAAIGSGAQSIIDAIKAAGYTVGAPSAGAVTASNDNSDVVTAVSSLQDTLTAVGSGVSAATTAAGAGTASALTNSVALQAALNGGVLTGLKFSLLNSFSGVG